MTSERELSFWSKVRYNSIYYPYYYYCQLESNFLGSEEPFSANLIINNLYLGNLSDSSNLQELKNNKITHILTVILGTSPLFPNDFKYLNIPVLDIEEENLVQYFDQTNQFIEDGIQNGNVLVHCRKGRSRSSSVVVAYLMYKQKLSLKDSLQLVKEKRSIAEPNEGFMKQLQNYETFLNKNS
jgi:protein-tyrosine phosphatase